MNPNIIIENRLQGYSIQSKQDELNALKEIFQEIALSALSRTDFFKDAAFQGGTCLRILYGLPRFSEDLDFILKEPNTKFNWSSLLQRIRTEFLTYNLNVETLERGNAEGSIKKAFIKEDSFGKILNLTYRRNASDIQKIQIKLEVDTHPPLGSEFESKYIDFPYPFSVSLQNMNSLFAGKCHALLCRGYTKGRDWFDFIWYVSRKTNLNFVFLKNALKQNGPWQGQELIVNKKWVVSQFREKIMTTNWEIAKKDVIRFLKPVEIDSLQHWKQEFFLHYLEKLEQYLS